MAQHVGLWMPWTAFLIALLLKLWRFITLIRQHLLGRSSRVDLFRRSLERSWQHR